MQNKMKILIAGDIVGSPGRQSFCRYATGLKAAGKIDMAIANAENAAGGKGLTAATAEELFAGGADAITLGDHTWDQTEMEKYIDRETRLTRPLNFAPGCPGRGFTTITTPHGDVTVVNIIGRVFLAPNDCPFRAMDDLLKKETRLGRIIIVDFHAEATSEKIVMGRYLDGRVSAMVGTHTHVQTSDECILPKGTAYITDLGMTGPKDSAIGRDLAAITSRFLTGMPAQFKIAKDDVCLEGVIIEIDTTNGRAKSISRIREHI